MIKYEVEQNIYTFNPEYLKSSINEVINFNVYKPSQEDVVRIMQSIEQFLSGITVGTKVVEQERHETEEEAKAYFGDEFVKEYEELIRELDDNYNMLYIHGTNLDTCPKICDFGLTYRQPTLSSTACTQSMPFGDENWHVNNFEELLNWRHREYKGLTLIAVPYECTYKNGLWNHFDNREREISDIHNYKINPDFIVGYIDVINKKIIRNPKYSKEHNYDGLDNDFELYRPREVTDNETLRKAAREFKIEDWTSEEIEMPKLREKEVDLEHVLYSISDMEGLFRSIEDAKDNTLSEDRYKTFMRELMSVYKELPKIVPMLKTEEEYKQEEKEDITNSDYVPTDTPSDTFGEFEWDFDEVDENGKNIFI